MSNVYKTAWLVIIITTVAVIFGSLINTPHLSWDDDSNIFANPYFQADMWLVFWKEHYFGLYVPVISTVWAALYKVGGGQEWPFRSLNLLLHLFNIGLLYTLLRSASRRWKLNEVMVLLAIAIFALHPLQVHTVAWISGGRDLLATTLALASVAVYYQKRTLPGFALATFFFLCALLSKPSVVILPAIVLLLDWIINDRPQRNSLLKMALWSFFSFCAIFLTEDAQQEFTPSNLSIGDHFLVVLDSYGFYLQKFLYPSELSANYARTPAAALQDSTALWSAVIAFTLLCSYGYLAWRTDRRYAVIFTWFLALLPVSGVITFAFQKISTVSDHYNYLPMACLATFVAFGLSRVAWDRLPAWAPHILLAAMIAVSARVSWARLDVWRSDEAFFTDMAITAPHAYSTAIGMSIVACEKNQNFEEGVRWTEIALKERPDDILALANQAYCFLHAKNYFRVIELEFYLGKLDLADLEVTQPTAYSSLLASIGTAYIEQKELADGYQFLCEAYRIKPSEPGHARNIEIASAILKRNGLDPVCEADLIGDDQEEEGEVIWPDAPQESGD